TWASDDAAARPTVLVLVGKEILQHETRRLEVAELQALFDEARQAKALVMRAALGLEVPAARVPRKRATTNATSTPTTNASEARSAPPAVVKGAGPGRMPKPAFVRPVKAAPPPPPKRVVHPKFGEGVLESQD